jgi:hypothetical protein
MRSRSSLATESPISVPSAPSSTRHRSVKPSSSSIASDVQKPSDGRQHQARTSAKKDREPIIEVMDELKEESEKEEEVLRKTSNVKTPRRSAGEDSGFSDYNPFQSGSEEAAERERRRRKVSCIYLTWTYADTASPPSACSGANPLNRAFRSPPLLHPSLRACDASVPVGKI